MNDINGRVVVVGKLVAQFDPTPQLLKPYPALAQSSA